MQAGERLHVAGTDGAHAEARGGLLSVAVGGIKLAAGGGVQLTALASAYSCRCILALMANRR